MHIKVILTKHLIYRFNERVSNTDFSPEKTIETMNEYFKKGVLVMNDKGECRGRIFFEGQTFALGIHLENQTMFTASTIMSSLNPRIKGKKVIITYVMK